MAESSTVAQNDQALATQYNNLRKDVLDNALGHDHEGTDGKRLAKNALRWTAAKLLLGAGAAEPTEIDQGAVLVVAETEVFNGTSPTTWTDLDLSGTIGSNAALVLLKVFLGGAQLYFAVRKDGDTDDFYTGTNAPHGAALARAEFSHIVVIVATSDTGKIEWKTASAQAGSTVDIIAYIK